ncbi:MAG: sialate O-acetylesterase [Methylacidiphilales bacterium]|nr:sialate O-acetylesterase [Candidatus Methylacidiphilales bacterium]
MNLPKKTLHLPAIFSEHMVLRAGRSNPIWGWAASGAQVVIRFQDETKKTSADPSGRWRLDLPAAPAGGPYRLEVSSGSESIVLSDVLAGEVWLCSGQSNMEWTVALSAHPQKEIAEGNHPHIRLLAIPRLAREKPQPDVEATWQICSPQTVANFSAVGYYFGRDIQQNLNVPVGLIGSSWGGTTAEAWTEWSFLENEPAFADFVEPYQRMLRTGTAEERKRKTQLVLDWQKIERYQDPGNRGYFWGWADLETDESEWRDFSAPAIWQEPDQHHQGAVWFRKKVVIPEDWADRDLILSLGELHDFDTSYFNGTKVGGLGKETPDAWCTPRYHQIPAALVRPGQVNTIATRVFVEFDQGGFTGGGPLAIYPEDSPIETHLSLEGTWKYRAEYAFDATIPPRVREGLNGPNGHNSPSNLYNGMIAPLAPFGFSGVIWYQGESNDDRPEQYKILFPRLIQSWRKAFGNSDLPFLFVLLANYRARQEKAVESGWGEIRAAQLEALKLPHTGVASAIDVGDVRDIHPKDKQTVGHRLALAARALVYQQKLVHSGPAFQVAKREGNRLRLVFTHIGSGLTTCNQEPLRGFAVRGSADGPWLWAEAEIQGNTMVVWNRELPEIEEVRYAWANNPIGNLYNKEGLPALPFRWELK